MAGLWYAKTSGAGGTRLDRPLMRSDETREASHEERGVQNSLQSEFTSPQGPRRHGTIRATAPGADQARLRRKAVPP